MTVALVTGANRGLGLETARQLFVKVPGIKVILASRDVSKVAPAVAEFHKQGFAASVVQLDVTDEASVKAAAAEVEKTHGVLDILINNAGIASKSSPLDVTAAASRDARGLRSERHRRHCCDSGVFTVAAQERRRAHRQPQQPPGFHRRARRFKFLS